MGHRLFGHPVGLIEIVAVFGESRHIDDAEIAAARGGAVFLHLGQFLFLLADLLCRQLAVVQQDGLVAVEGDGFAQIVEAGPHELAADGRIFVEGGKFLVGQTAPAGFLQVVGRTLETAREIDTTGAQGGAGFAGEAGQMLMPRLVEEGAVEIRSSEATRRIVHAVDIHLQLSAVQSRFGRPGRAEGDRAGGIVAVDHLSEMACHAAFGAVLFVHFIAGAPEYNRRMVAVAAYQCPQILFVPFPEQRGIIAGFLAHGPAVEGLVHDEEAHLIGQIQQFGSRGVVGSADGIAAEALQDLELAL